MPAPWPKAEHLTSERLWLEPLRPDHATEMVAVLADPALYAFIGGRPPTAHELRERYERQSRGSSPDGSQGWLNWVLRTRDDEAQAVGTIQATLRDRVDGRRSAELAWVVSSRWQGRGYATEGTAAAMAWLRSAGIDGFEAHIHPQHEASAAVAARLGMTRTGSERDGELQWAQIS